MVALVSGSSGFIGRHLCDALLKLNIEVVNLHRDWLKSTKLTSFLQQLQPNYIFHCGAYGNMSHQKDEDEILVTNIFGTYNLLKSLKDVKYSSCVLLGSSSEYGHHPVLSEDTLPLPETFYAASKVSSTMLGQVFAHQYDKPIVTVRPFSVYGPGEAEFRFIPRILRGKYAGEPFTLSEDVRHDWIYIDDLIAGILLASDKAQELKGKVLNLGTGKETYNSDIVRMLWPEYDGPFPKKDKRHWKADISLAKSLGWSPKVSLTEGLVQTEEYYVPA